MKKSLFRPFLLAVSVIAGLLLLGMLPQWGIGEWRAKPVDLLSSLRTDTLVDTTAEQPVIAVRGDSCRSGVTCIADYAADTAKNMAYFYDALNEAAARPVRIAFIGDSFIEADILTDALRDLLQERYGGCGVGYVTIDHVARTARHTIHQRTTGFEMHSAVDKHYEASLPDLSGYYFLPQTGATVELSGNAEYSPRLARADVSQFLFDTRGGHASFTASTDGGIVQRLTAETRGGVQCLTFQAPMQRVRWAIEGGGSTVCYGLTMDGRTGVALDNLSLRGSTGLTIPAIPAERLVRLDALRHYDLVVMLYGLNVMARGKRDYTAYGVQVERMISHLRQAMPYTAFLVMGIADRCGKLPDGSIGTLPEVVPLIEAQATAATKTGVAFWNTYEAMGGKDAMAQFANATPPLAARDYTHISEEGGQRIAQWLFDALVWGHELYNMKQHRP